MKFNSEMQLAIEQGVKVVTRRLLEPPPPYDYGDDGIDVLWATSFVLVRLRRRLQVLVCKGCST